MNISLAAITELRNKTGAGLLMTKKALEDAKGDMDAAEILLRQQGVTIGQGRASRATHEGVVDCYIHTGSRTGVMIEVQCETDFVARNQEFRTFVRDLCLQIAATKPTYISRKEIPEAEIQKEFQIYRVGLEGKPQMAQDKIIAGKFDKFYASVCLLDQPFVKDPSKTIAELLAEQTLKTRENIQIKRFVRYEIADVPDSIKENVANGCH